MEVHDCSAALSRMMWFIDNELDQADCAQIQSHLDECAPCLDKYQLERAVKELVSRSCSEAAPEGLRERIHLRIQSVQITLESGPDL
ncbi:MAG TPA: mycothiol system anti-sigma-R factor [Marmoricola sp.]|nr:mycothiol system anti-sigma-R factor [Marmoricola sp.]HNJ77766.1 mycothiol system anti-sigma-R factor [Marmoricola sp.]HNN48961.1 mycothiol system anti-sigma-R factor [Marmoricola sp.]HNO40795.1 mycothiol system anti-sigma-R factor [Marmoricola sp.]